MRPFTAVSSLASGLSFRSGSSRISSTNRPSPAMPSMSISERLESLRMGLMKVLV